MLLHPCAWFLAHIGYSVFIIYDQIYKHQAAKGMEFIAHTGGSFEVYGVNEI